MTLTIPYDHRDPRQSYELIAEEFGLAQKQTCLDRGQDALVTPCR